MLLHAVIHMRNDDHDSAHDTDETAQSPFNPNYPLRLTLIRQIMLFSIRYKHNKSTIIERCEHTCMHMVGKMTMKRPMPRIIGIKCYNRALAWQDVNGVAHRA